MKNIAVVAALVVLAGCASKPTSDVAATNAAAAGAAASGITPGTQQDFEQSAGNRVYFAYDQYTLSPQARATLDKQAAWLKQYPNVKIVVAGNCDERGTREYNLALGARRAEAARSYLVSLGVQGSRLTTVSYGKERPIAPGADESAWSANRNATATISGA